jgi:hypothetical protein
MKFDINKLDITMKKTLFTDHKNHIRLGRYDSNKMHLILANAERFQKDRPRFWVKLK